MRVFKKEKTKQRIMTIILVVMLFNFICPTFSAAGGYDGGGTLFDPLMHLMCGIGDAIENLLQKIMLPGSPAAIQKRNLKSVIYESEHSQVKDPSWLDKVDFALDDLDAWLATVPIVGDIGIGTGELINPLLGLKDGEMTELYEEMYYPLIIYSPAAIFSNMVPALDVNFINPSVTYRGGKSSFILMQDANSITGLTVGFEYEENEAASTEEEAFKGNIAYKLRTTIATWYVALRNIAVVALLSVLVYVGIRIVLSSTAGETAKYKTMLKDWLIAMCILVFMHYMMAFFLKTAEMMTDLFVTGNILGNVNTVSNVEVKGDVFMNNARVLAQTAQNDDGEADASLRFGYSLMYLVLIFYTLIFTWKYLKRFIYLAFLTMISPMVALTYPLDKMSDKSAQAFNMWFKEYLFNILIQPIHLLLYTVLVTSAVSFASENIIYAIVAIGFLLEGEKLVKSLFGLDKAKGGSMSAAVTGGAIFGTLAGAAKKGVGMLPGGGSKKSGGSKQSDGSSKVRFADRGANSDAPKGLGAFNTTSSTASLPQKSKYNTAPFKKISNGYAKVSNKAKSAKNAIDTKAKNVRSKISNSAPARFGRDIAKSPIGGTIKGVGRVAGRFINADNAKKVARLAAMGIGAATLGSVGLAAGIASENDKDMIAGATLGAGLGSMIGGKAYDIAESLPEHGGNIRDSFQEGYYGSEYEEKILNPRADREWKNSSETKNYYKNKYGDEWKERMDQSMEIRKQGITDQKEIDRALKLVEKNSGLSASQAANVINFGKDYTKADVTTNRQQIKDVAKGMVNGNDAIAEQIVQLMEQDKKLR